MILNSKTLIQALPTNRCQKTYWKRNLALLRSKKHGTSNKNRFKIKHYSRWMKRVQ
jgi:hypothetical protein